MFHIFAQDRFLHLKSEFTPGDICLFPVHLLFFRDLGSEDHWSRVTIQFQNDYSQSESICLHTANISTKCADSLGGSITIKNNFIISSQECSLLIVFLCTASFATHIYVSTVGLCIKCLWQCHKVVCRYVALNNVIYNLFIQLLLKSYLCHFHNTNECTFFVSG